MADIPLLGVRGLSHHYGSGTTRQQVLCDVSLTLRRGEMVALLGQSGSGKSTLLNQLGLLEHASEGEIWLDGQPVHALDDNARSDARNRHIGFIFQFHHLLSPFTALENVMMPLRIRGRPASELTGRARQLLARAGLAGYEQRFPRELSGGQQQRVAIVRALMASPALVLADEPTGNLDSGTAEQVFGLMREFNRQEGTTFLLVTHDQGLAARCDRQLRLVDGRLRD